MRAAVALSCAAFFVWTSPTAAAQELLLVACAPGYPGSTARAQPTMDDFAALVAAAAGWDDGRLAAEYREDEAAGVRRLREPMSALALVPLPFFLKHETELDLRPLVQATQADGRATETWSLVAAAGAVRGPSDLDGWEIVGVAAYAPIFVRTVVLGDWGPLPEGTAIAFSARVLRAIRRAIQGERVAVLLDRTQTAALPSLPGADALEVIASSAALPAALLVTVGDRLAAAEIEPLRAALIDVHERADRAEILTAMRLTRFAPVDDEALAASRLAYRNGA